MSANDGVAPWLGYDSQDVATIARFVAKSSPAQAREVDEYERLNGNRPEVLAATAARLDKLHA